MAMLWMNFQETFFTALWHGAVAPHPEIENDNRQVVGTIFLGAMDATLNTNSKHLVHVERTIKGFSWNCEESRACSWSE